MCLCQNFIENDTFRESLGMNFLTRITYQEFEGHPILYFQNKTGDGLTDWVANARVLQERLL